MIIIEWSKKFKEFWKSTWNKILYTQEIPQRVEIISDEAEEKPSPLPRLARMEKFLDKLDDLAEEWFEGPVLVGVTDTNSMDGIVDYGHQVLLIPFEDTSPKRKEDIIVGDIIWFRRMSDGAENVLHRVIEVHDGWVVTRGDNLVVSDGPIPYSDIKGYLGAVIY